MSDLQNKSTEVEEISRFTNCAEAPNKSESYNPPFVLWLSIIILFLWLSTITLFLWHSAQQPQATLVVKSHQAKTVQAELSTPNETTPKLIEADKIVAKCIIVKGLGGEICLRSAKNGASISYQTKNLHVNINKTGVSIGNANEKAFTITKGGKKLTMGRAKGNRLVLSMLEKEDSFIQMNNAWASLRFALPFQKEKNNAPNASVKFNDRYLNFEFSDNTWLYTNSLGIKAGLHFRGKEPPEGKYVKLNIVTLLNHLNELKLFETYSDLKFEKK